MSVHTVTLSYESVRATVADYGARLTSLIVPDFEGCPVDIVLGHNNPNAYLGDNTCMGAVVGRNANRISGARCIIGDIIYQLEPNDGPNNNHSAPYGFDRQPWRIDHASLTERSVTLTLVSPHQSQNLPGTMLVSARYELTDAQTLTLTLTAVSDQDTICNLTTHTYWNLNGDDGDALRHTLSIPAERYFPTDDAFIPLDAQPVQGTPFDFRTPCTLRDAMAMPTYANPITGNDLADLHDSQLALARGYNHAFDFGPIHADSPDKPIPMASLCGNVTGITMDMSCNAPAMLLYSNGFMDNIPGRNERRYGPASGLALEPGFVPNSINNTHAGTTPSPLLYAGQQRVMTVRYRFGTADLR